MHRDKSIRGGTVPKKAADKPSAAAVCDFNNLSFKNPWNKFCTPQIHTLLGKLLNCNFKQNQTQSLYNARKPKGLYFTYYLLFLSLPFCSSFEGHESYYRSHQLFSQLLLHIFQRSTRSANRQVKQSAPRLLLESTKVLSGKIETIEVRVPKTSRGGLFSPWLQA